MDPSFTRELVRAYMEALSKLEAYEALIHLEYFILSHYIDEYRHKNGHEPPNGYENNFDLRAAAETAILIYGGEIWHDKAEKNDTNTDGSSA